MAKTKFSTKYLKKLSSILLTFLLIFPTIFIQNIPLSKADVIYAVTNTNDSGVGSLREAITNANAHEGAEIIEFTVSGTLTLLSNLPDITGAININGATAPDDFDGPDFTIDANGFSQGLRIINGTNITIKGLAIENANSSGIVINGVSQIFIGGTASRELNTIDNCTYGIMVENNTANVNIRNNLIGATTGNAVGIFVDGNSSNITIGETLSGTHNTVVNSEQEGIRIFNGDTVTIAGNYVGVIGGNAAAANTNAGIRVDSDSSDVVIGGDTAAHRNIISGNTSYGIQIQANGTQVQGNYIGTNADGNAAIANSSHGISIEGADNVLIGGEETTLRNVISGNTSSGINIAGDPDGLTVKNNYIGLGADGTTDLGNGQDGITSFGLTNATFGGSEAGNYISGNTWNGLNLWGTSTGTVVYGNVMGLGVDDSVVANGKDGLVLDTEAVTVGGTEDTLRNIISGNGENGIDIFGNTNIIKNNYIGLASDGITKHQNTQTAIRIQSGNNNQIGGTEANTGNYICVAAAQKGVDVAANSSGNTIRRNAFIAPDLGGWLRINFMNPATSNEGIAEPTVNNSSTDSYIYGTTCANCYVDVTTDSFWETTTADADGNWGLHANIVGDNIFTQATNTSLPYGSSSRATEGIALIADATAPTIPTVTSATITNNPAYTLTGTKEAYSNIIEKGTFLEEQATIVAIDQETTWSYAATLEEGINTFTLVSKDYKANTSDPIVTHAVTLDSIAPSTPTYSFSSTVGTDTTTISGSGTEALASVYVNGADTGTNVDNDGTFSVSVSLAAGTNSIPIKIVDDAGNESSETTLSITKTSESVGFFGGAGQNSSRNTNKSSTNNNTETQSDTTKDTPTTETQTQPNTTNSAGDDDDDNTDQTSQTTTNPVETPYYYTPTYTAPVNTTPVYTTPAEPAPETQKTANTVILEKETTKAVEATTLFKNLINESDDDDLSAERDTDGDGIADRTELATGTNPNSQDSDEDGINDTQEVENGTDPGAWDTDGDGISDKEEQPEQVNTYNKKTVTDIEKTTFVTENNLSTPISKLGTTDFDRDGISDEEELALGTDPTDKDSDKDGILDGEELLNYGTNPKTPTTAKTLEDLHITNFKTEEVVQKGPQVISGRGVANTEVKIYKIAADGTQELIGETKTDETGKYNIMTNSLEVGNNTIIAVLGNKNAKDISQPIKLTVVENTGVKAPTNDENVLKNGQTITNVPTATIYPTANQKIVVIWQSTIYSQTYIADASGSPITVTKELPKGEHTLTYYSINEENVKSAPTQIKFNVNPQAGFVSGNTGDTSNTGVIFGATVLLIALIGMTVVIKKRSKA